MDFINITTGIFVSMLGITIVFVGYYFSKKIGILHVIIYFVASFVILTGGSFDNAVRQTVRSWLV